MINCLRRLSSYTFFFQCGKVLIAPCVKVEQANQSKAIADMSRVVGNKAQHPEDTPWSMGSDWPVRPELIQATRVRLLAAAKLVGGDEKTMLEPLKESLAKLVDEAAVQQHPTAQQEDNGIATLWSGTLWCLRAP